jgi:hypothetical protein
MLKAGINKAELQAMIAAMSDLDFARFVYCQEMAGTYMAVGHFESMLISAMLTCDRVKLKKALGLDMEAWEHLLAKKALLEGSTLGSLIKILERNNVDQADLAYLRWLKGKRDYFVHRLFHEGAWPGDLDKEGCRHMQRRLLAIQIWLERGANRIWLIFERAGFAKLTRISDGGFLAMNPGFEDLISEEVLKKASSAGACE